MLDRSAVRIMAMGGVPGSISSYQPKPTPFSLRCGSGSFHSPPVDFSHLPR